ncbi:MAG: hypothetical protein ACYC09_09995 [Bacteroidota bacterium]
MKSIRIIIITVVAVLFSLQFHACDKLTDTDDDASGTFDSQLTGVWFDVTAGDGLEIKSDGTFQILSLNSQGRIAYNTDDGFISGKFVKASGGVFETEEKYNEDGTVVTYVSKGKYTVSNGGANLAVSVETMNGEPFSQQYNMVKKSMGEIITSGTTAGLTFIFDNQTYVFTDISAYQSGSTIDLSAHGTTIAYFSLYTIRTVGEHQVDGDSTGLWFEFGSTTYTSDTGTVTVTVVDGKNTQGIFSVTVEEQFNSTNKKNITGSFNVTLP